MKTLIAIAVLLVAVVSPASFADGKYLNVAILSIPDRYLADVPIANRGKLLSLLSDSPFGAKGRLDYAKGWLHWVYDGPPQHSPNATSMFWLKLLPRENDKPLVFVHMSKPFAGGRAPGKDQTFVLERAANGWRDVTRSVMPKVVDQKLHFRPQRSTNVIEVAAWKQIKRRDGAGQAYGFGERKLDLIWSDGGFRVREPDSPKLSSDTAPPK